jgi:hypothetical protein
MRLPTPWSAGTPPGSNARRRYHDAFATFFAVFRRDQIATLAASQKTEKTERYQLINSFRREPVTKL